MLLCAAVTYKTAARKWCCIEKSVIYTRAAVIKRLHQGSHHTVWLINLDWCFRKPNNSTIMSTGVHVLTHAYHNTIILQSVSVIPTHCYCSETNPCSSLVQNQFFAPLRCGKHFLVSVQTQKVSDISLHKLTACFFLMSLITLQSTNRPLFD